MRRGVGCYIGIVLKGVVNRLLRVRPALPNGRRSRLKARLAHGEMVRTLSISSTLSLVARLAKHRRERARKSPRLERITRRPTPASLLVDCRLESWPTAKMIGDSTRSNFCTFVVGAASRDGGCNPSRDLHFMDSQRSLIRSSDT